MEIRTTNPELEELIRILAANNAERTLREFASICGQMLKSDLNKHTDFDSGWQGSKVFPYSHEGRRETQTSTDHIVRVVGVNKSHEPAAAAYLCLSSWSLPSAKQSALHAAYWERQYVILKGVKDEITLEEIYSLVRITCARQVKSMRELIRDNKVTKLLPVELQKPGYQSDEYP